MLSAVRLAASRVAVRVATRPVALCAVRQTQPAVFAVRHFSAPPVRIIIMYFCSQYTLCTDRAYMEPFVRLFVPAMDKVSMRFITDFFLLFPVATIDLSRCH
jgi:hypothetical protein